VEIANKYVQDELVGAIKDMNFFVYLLKECAD